LSREIMRDPKQDPLNLSSVLHQNVRRFLGQARSARRRGKFRQKFPVEISCYCAAMAHVVAV
jgi:hypothetical protein